jgi:general secretion pathway protein K
MKRIPEILRGHSGVALITVILIISILVAASLELNRSSRSDIYDAANTSDGIKLIYIAKSGFYGAATLLVNSKNEYETLRDDWANAQLISSRSKTLFPNGSFLVRIEDEKGKIPLNKLVSGSAVNANIKDTLLRLLEQPEFDLQTGKASEIVDAIIDWIDDNEEIAGLGAESSYYASLTVPYKAKNAQLDCIEELLMVKGVTAELFGGTKEKPGLAQYVTIYGTEAININTAPKMVLRALSADITSQLADEMDEYRRAKGNDLSTVAWYQKVSGMENITINPGLIEMAKSNYFRIYSTGIADKMAQSVSGVIQLSPFQIMSWRQD